MIPHDLDESPSQQPERKNGNHADSLMARLAQHRNRDAWRETVTRHTPESWPAARLALQARIAALDFADDKTVLDLTEEAA